MAVQTETLAKEKYFFVLLKTTKWNSYKMGND